MNEKRYDAVTFVLDRLTGTYASVIPCEFLAEDVSEEDALAAVKKYNLNRPNQHNPRTVATTMKHGICQKRTPSVIS